MSTSICHRHTTGEGSKSLFPPPKKIILLSDDVYTCTGCVTQAVYSICFKNDDNMCISLYLLAFPIINMLLKRKLQQILNFATANIPDFVLYHTKVTIELQPAFTVCQTLPLGSALHFRFKNKKSHWF